MIFKRWFDNQYDGSVSINEEKNIYYIQVDLAINIEYRRKPKLFHEKKIKL